MPAPLRPQHGTSLAPGQTSHSCCRLGATRHVTLSEDRAVGLPFCRSPGGPRGDGRPRRCGARRAARPPHPPPGAGGRGGVIGGLQAPAVPPLPLRQHPQGRRLHQVGHRLRHQVHAAHLDAGHQLGHHVRPAQRHSDLRPVRPRARGGGRPPGPQGPVPTRADGHRLDGISGRVVLAEGDLRGAAGPPRRQQRLRRAAARRPLVPAGRGRGRGRRGARDAAVRPGAPLRPGPARLRRHLQGLPRLRVGTAAVAAAGQQTINKQIKKNIASGPRCLTVPASAFPVLQHDAHRFLIRRVSFVYARRASLTRPLTFKNTYTKILGR